MEKPADSAPAAGVTTLDISLIRRDVLGVAPYRYTTHTKPARRDWLRTQPMDKGVPVLLNSTPQDQADFSKFQKKKLPSRPTAEEVLGRGGKREQISVGEEVASEN